MNQDDDVLSKDLDDKSDDLELDDVPLVEDLELTLRTERVNRPYFLAPALQSD